MASHIVFTQVSLDQAHLLRLVVGLWSNQWQHSEKISQEQLDHLQVQKKVRVVAFQKKSDLRKELNTLYESSDSEYMLYLGDLSSYSLPMQEGMLRLLEEPPSNADVVVAAPDDSRILPTIRSRCRIHSLSFTEIVQNLSAQDKGSIQKHLPPANSVAKDLIQGTFSSFKVPPKLERGELDIWLWQLSINLRSIYTQHPRPEIAQRIKHILKARQLNQANVQKRFVIEELAL